MVGHEGGAQTYDMQFERMRRLSLDEVSERLDTLSGQVEDIKAHYIGPIGRFRKKLKPEDMEALGQAFGEILPLSFNHEVQKQLLAANPQENNSDLTFFRINTLSMELGVFMARFENTGITLIQTHGVA
jgi:hypothetical protein